MLKYASTLAYEGACTHQLTVAETRLISEVSQSLCEPCAQEIHNEVFWIKFQDKEDAWVTASYEASPNVISLRHPTVRNHGEFNSKI